jgi:hypothetical protein
MVTENMFANITNRVSDSCDLARNNSCDFAGKMRNLRSRERRQKAKA